MGKPVLTISIDKETIADIVMYAMENYQAMIRKNRKEREKEKIAEIEVPEDGTGFYRMAQLLEIFPWRRTKILEMVAAGEFPRPVRNCGKCSIWPKDEIHKFIERIKAGEETE